MPGLGQFAGKIGTRAIGRGAVRINRHLPGGDVGRGGKCCERDDEPDRGNMKQRHPLQAQRGNRNQRQRGQKEQRNSPIGLHVDRENQAAERRADRHHDLDNPDIARLRHVHARVGAAAPNTFDSMTYHMPRVMHWAADGTVAFYPTSIIRQLYSAPGAEYAVLQFQVLSGGDHAANLVQWFCMVGSVIGASLVAKQLGAPLRGQVGAAIAVGTLPMGILQASSTQNDYAVAFWLICVVAMGFAYVAAPSLEGAFWVAASLGIGLLTKGTGYIFAAPLVLLLGSWMVLRLRARVLAPAAVMVAVPLLLNLGIYVRNESLFHNPLAPADETASLANQTFAPSATASNLVRDAVLQFATPWPSVNRRIASAIETLHTGLLRIDVNDPRTTWGSEGFRVNALSLDEDFAGNPLPAVLAA